jgi:5-methylcytosine-specific restriction endonuclease McrA
MIEKCPKCNIEFDSYSKWGNKKFCSRKCANSRIFSDESKQKKSHALKGRTSKIKISVESRKRAAKKTSEQALIKYLNTPFEELGMENRRRRVFEEQNHECNKCGIGEWFGNKISLELEHKDGNRLNNERNNLEGLCPNCHSITDTWRGRNKPSKNGENKISDEFLLECLKSSKNIRQGLLLAGIAAKGDNYDRAKKLLSDEIS